VAERLAESVEHNTLTFDDIDADGDGFIDRGEWDVAVLHRRPTPRVSASAALPRVRSAFSGVTMSCEMNLMKTAEAGVFKVRSVVRVGV